MLSLPPLNEKNGYKKSFWHFISTNTIFLKFSGIFIIFYTLYFRFIRPRATGPIDVTYTEFKFYLYIFLICTFFLTLIMIISAKIFVNNLLKQIPPNRESYFFKFKEKIVYLGRALNEIYDKMVEQISLPFFNKSIERYPIGWVTLREFVRSWSKNLGLILIIFYFLPPMLISFTYFIEVVIYKEFKYFPLIIFLMVFPIGVRILLYSVRLHCKKSKEIFDKTIIEKKLEGGRRQFSWGKDPFIPEEERNELFLHGCVKLRQENLGYIELFDLYRFNLYILPARLYFQIFSLSCWLSSFSFQLYLILLNK